LGITRIYCFSVITCNYWLRLFTVTYIQTDTCIIISRQKNIGYAKYLLLFFNSFQYFIIFFKFVVLYTWLYSIIYFMCKISVFTMQRLVDFCLDVYIHAYCTSVYEHHYTIFYIKIAIFLFTSCLTIERSIVFKTMDRCYIIIFPPYSFFSPEKWVYTQFSPRKNEYIPRFPPRKNEYILNFPPGNPSMC
jgi:hypothetical protein